MASPQTNHRFLTDFSQIWLSRSFTNGVGVQFHFDDYRFDATNEQLWRGAKELRVTAKALQVLQHLLTHTGQILKAYPFAERLYQLTQRQPDPASQVMAHYSLGLNLFYQGELATARSHFEQAIDLYDPQQDRSFAFHPGSDSVIAACIYAVRVLWYLGYPRQARLRCHEAFVMAREAAHPYSLALVRLLTAMFHKDLRKMRVAQMQAEATIAICTEQGFPHFLAMATIVRGWALAMLGDSETGIAVLHQGLDAWRAAGAEVSQTRWLAMLAEAYWKSGQTDAGLAALGEALKLVDAMGERYEEAEIHRLKGELLLQSESLVAESNKVCEAAEDCFQQALLIARRQQARSFELRAAMSLGRLWHRHDRQADARALLTPIYDWFTEGADTPDLQDAEQLLVTLSNDE